MSERETKSGAAKGSTGNSTGGLADCSRAGQSLTASAADALVAAIGASGSPVCVGLDPVIENIPAGVRAESECARVEAFSLGVLEAVRPFAPAVKFQSACYERYGWRGVQTLERAMDRARQLGFVVVLDAKRGDIGISAAHYAAAASNAGAHFVTVNGYLGQSGIEPFLKQGLGVFVLVRTSNPDSAAFQTAPLREGGTVAELMARSVRKLGERAESGQPAGGLSNVGAVVGATQSAEARALRTLMPDQVFLVPGFGAQGGTADDVRAMVRTGQPIERAGVLVTASRSVLYPQHRGDAGSNEALWDSLVGEAARGFAKTIRDALADQGASAQSPMNSAASTPTPVQKTNLT